MEIICSNCQSKLRVPDVKLPPGKSFSLRCPKCETKIHINGSRLKGAEAAGDAVAQAPDEDLDMLATSADLSRESFELARLGNRTALVCEPYTATRKKLTATLKSLDFYVVAAEDTRDALKRMRYHRFDLLVVDESFDTSQPEENGVLIFVRNLEMAVRRHMFIVMLTNRFRSLNQLTALHRSVNLIINHEHLNRLEEILARSLEEEKRFYDTFNESLKSLGKA